MPRLRAGPVRPSLGSPGFTLIEIIVVVNLMLVLAGMITPRLRASGSLQVHRTARLVASHLELARTHALAQRSAVRVVFDEDAGTYVAYVDENKDGTISETEAEMEAFPRFGQRELPTLISFGRGSAEKLSGDSSPDPVTLTDDELDLSVQGIPDPWGTTGTIYLVHRDDTDAVSAVAVSASGSFKAWRWSAEDKEWQ